MKKKGFIVRKMPDVGDYCMISNGKQSVLAIYIGDMSFAPFGDEMIENPIYWNPVEMMYKIAWEHPRGEDSHEVVDMTVKDERYEIG
jgi:hypothetical protein